jgi:hypothetical protein
MFLFLFDEDRADIDISNAWMREQVYCRDSIFCIPSSHPSQSQHIVLYFFSIK